MSLTPATTIYSNPAVKRQEPGDSNGGSVSNHFQNFTLCIPGSGY